MTRYAAIFFRWSRFTLGRWVNRFAHPSGGPLRRLKRRYVMVGSAVAMVGVAVAVPHKVADAARQTCRASSGLSDFCGRMGVQGVPVRQDRIDWERREPGSCPALDRYLQLHPKGVFAEQAKNLLARKRRVRSRDPAIKRERITTYVRKPFEPEATSSAAEAAARQRAKDDAEAHFCQTEPGLRLIEVKIVSFIPHCEPIRNGQACAADYTAECISRGRPLVDQCD